MFGPLYDKAVAQGWEDKGGAKEGKRRIVRALGGAKQSLGGMEYKAEGPGFGDKKESGEERMSKRENCLEENKTRQWNKGRIKGGERERRRKKRRQLKWEKGKEKTERGRFVLRKKMLWKGESGGRTTGSYVER